jgi:hypothetical protein
MKSHTRLAFFKVEALPSFILLEKHLFATSSLVLIFFKKVVYSLAKVGKSMTPF